MSATSTTSASDTSLAELNRRSVARLGDVVRAGAFRSLARVDPHTGEVIDNEARALFASLPVVTPVTGPDELVDLGLLKAKPKGWASAFETPRYRPGRSLFVRTNVAQQPSSERQPVGAYESSGKVAFTHRGVLKGESGERFLVHVEGADQALAFKKSDVFSWNEPSGVAATGGSISGVEIDYRAPRLRAFIAAAYLSVQNDIADLDFSADVLEVPERLAAMGDKQARILTLLMREIDMRYAGRGSGYSGPKASSLIGGGSGVCFVQRAVAGAFLQSFSRAVAFELQMAVGRTLRLGVPHGFNIVTLLPSAKRYVSDPAWGEPLTDLEVAFFGPNWGHDRRLEGFEGEQDIAVRSGDVDVPTLQLSSAGAVAAAEVGS